MFQLKSRSGFLRFFAGHSTLAEVLKDLKFLTYDTESVTLSEALDTSTGRYYRVYNNEYEMTLTEIKYYEEEVGDDFISK